MKGLPDTMTSLKDRLWHTPRDEVSFQVWKPVWGLEKSSGHQDTWERVHNPIEDQVSRAVNLPTWAALGGF